MPTFKPPADRGLCDARSIAFGARVDALWLADGDVELAARLLRTTPQSLIESFEDAHEAETAFCGRPLGWRPEHSLSGTFGSRSENGQTFRVDVSSGLQGQSPSVLDILHGPAAEQETCLGHYEQQAGHWVWVPGNAPLPAMTSALRVHAAQAEAFQVAIGIGRTS